MYECLEEGVSAREAPMTIATFRAKRRVEGKGLQDRFVEPVTHRIACCVARSKRGDNLRFSAVSPAEWPRVREMRRAVYARRLPSLLSVLDPSGQDVLDASSFVFAAWLNGDPVATLRATPYPFETTQYVDEQTLGGYLGANWRRDYVEWGRLVAEPAATSRRIVPALITYAGLFLLLNTPYAKYFGYTRKRVRGVFRGFRVLDDSLTFRIPSRGAHDYLILKGDMSLDFVHALPQWLSSARATQLAARAETQAHPPDPRSLDSLTGRTVIVTRTKRTPEEHGHGGHPL